MTFISSFFWQSFEEKFQFKNFKKFFLQNKPIHFHINRTSVVRPVKQNQLSFPSTEINKPLLPQSIVSRRSDSVQKPIQVVVTDQMPDHT